MAGINKAILVGRLGKDPEIRYTPSGTAIANFTMATSENYKDKDGNKKYMTEIVANTMQMLGKPEDASALGGGQTVIGESAASPEPSPVDEDVPF